MQQGIVFLPLSPHGKGVSMMDVVSVVVPAWGETPLLDRARVAVQAQTYSAVEFVVAAPPEDGPHTLPAARMAGVERATGQWIVFCDADDWLERDAVEKMLAAAEREGADCVCCGLVRDRANGKSLVRKFDPQGPSDTYNALVNKLFRRELLEGLVIDKSVTLGEDLMVTAQVLAKAKKVVILDEAFYHYCENPSSVTHRQDGRKRVEDLARVDEILRTALPGPEHAAFHDRVTRDALLLWIRYRLFDRSLWRKLRSRMKGRLLADPRHGIIKKGALACAACLFD